MGLGDERRNRPQVGGRDRAASTAAGPAFEGAGLSCGALAVPGAIDKAAWSEGGFSVSVIGGGAPTGICGTGYIDLLAHFLRRGLISPSGLLSAPGGAVEVAPGVSIGQHRFAAVMILAVVAALLVGLTLSEHQRRVAMAERDRANTQRDRTEENLRLAQELVADVIRPAAEQMTDLPFTRDTQREVLKQARDFYERALVQVEDDPEPRRQLAWIYQKLGHIAWCTDSPDCEPALRRSLAILEDLAREFPHHPDDRLTRSWSHYWLTACFWADLRFEEALPESRASIALAEDLVAQFPTTDEYRLVLTSGEFQLAQALEGVGKLDEAERHYRTAFTGERLHRWVRVAGRNGLCSVLIQLGRYDEAQQVLQDVA